MPVRGVLPALAAIDNDTVPLPVPVAPPDIVIHESALTAVQAQPVMDVTEMLPVDAADATDRLVDDRVYVQAAAAWVTLNVPVPTLMVAERSAVAGLASTLYATVPFPLPLGGLVTVSHGALLDAVHAHPLFADTEKLPVATSDPTDTPAGENE